MKTWTTYLDGWQSRTDASGTVEYRYLMQDTGKPAYAGAARRYATVSRHPDGSVYGRSQYGYMRRYASVEAAKAAIGPQVGSR